MTTSITPSRYAVEIRDKNFYLKDRLENNVSNVTWEWNRVGGCGKASLTVDGNYLRVKVQPDDDIRIYLSNTTTGATLWYRGYVESVTPSIDSGNAGSLKLDVMGYSGWLDRIIVQDTNAPKVYTSTEVSEIVSSLVTTFAIPNCAITLGSIDGSGFTPDILSFKVSMKDALNTLADLIGTIEYGVDANLTFYWKNQSEAVVAKYYLGGNVTKISDRVDFKGITNKIYFEGGDPGTGTFVSTGLADDSIARYGLHEEIVSNGSIVTNSVANQYMSAYLAQKARPARQLSVSLKNITRRFEATVPMGAISVIDRDLTQSRYEWGTTANGGDNKKWGTLSSGGSGILWGGFRKDQIDRISYSLSPEDGRINADVQFGNSYAVSKASAAIKDLENIQESLRQRSL